MSEPRLAAWKLPTIVAAIAVSIVAGFYLGGPGLGMAVGALAAATIVTIAVRNPPRRPIVPPPPRDLRRHILLVLGRPLEDGGAIEAIANVARGTKGEEPAEIVVVAPCRSRFLARWTSDLAPGKQQAERDLVVSVASLAKAEIDAAAQIGDEDLVQTVEDSLRSFPATEVILVTGAPDRDASGNAAAEDLRDRLQPPLRHLVVPPDPLGRGPELGRSTARAQK
jgi:hypothetical protein